MSEKDQNTIVPVPIVGEVEEGKWTDLSQDSPTADARTRDPKPALAGWQPIETAPEGVELIVFALGDVSVAKGSRSGWHAFHDGWPATNIDGDAVELFPSHWMPLPEPPK